MFKCPNLTLILHRLIQKSAVFYALIFLLGMIIFDSQKIYARVLNFSTVSIDYLYGLSIKKEKFDRERFRAYVDYYKQFIRYSAYSADALGMLAFCYAYAGDQSRAISLYEKAIAIEPSFFWFHYNLGLIYFKQKKYAQAAMSLKKALSSDRRKTLELISESRILIYFGPSDKMEPSAEEAIAQKDVYLDMVRHLKEGAARAQEMLVLSYFQMKEYAGMFKWAQLGIKHFPANRAFFCFYAGVAAYQLQNYSQALGFLNRCIKEDPNYVNAYYYLNLILKAMKQDDEAALALLTYQSLRVLYPQGRLEDHKKYNLVIF